jgi:hypothetical protein
MVLVLGFTHPLHPLSIEFLLKSYLIAESFMCKELGIEECNGIRTLAKIIKFNFDLSQRSPLIPLREGYA